MSNPVTGGGKGEKGGFDIKLRGQSTIVTVEEGRRKQWDGDREERVAMTAGLCLVALFCNRFLSSK